jgi:hypothetical protein
MTQQPYVEFTDTIQKLCNVGQRQALAFFTAYILAGLITNAALAEPTECTGGWNNTYVDVRGTGSASIQHQCRPNESPCPPTTELRRRAIVAAKVLALADAQARYAGSVHQTSEVIDGRAASHTVAAAEGDTYDIEYCVQIHGDTANVRLVGAKW